MPVYSYKCENCAYTFDQFQHFTDDPLTVCPNCNEVALRKVYQPVGIVFKGKGFYATDNRSPSGQTSSHKSESEPGSTASKGSGETKPKDNPPGSSSETKQATTQTAA